MSPGFCRLEYIFLIDKLQPGIVLESVDHSLGRGFVDETLYARA